MLTPRIERIAKRGNLDGDSHLLFALGYCLRRAGRTVTPSTMQSPNKAPQKGSVVFGRRGQIRHLYEPHKFLIARSGFFLASRELAGPV